MLISPPVASRNRGSRFSRVVLPLPVAPMTAVTVPGAAVKLTPSRTGASAPGYAKDTLRNSTALPSGAAAARDRP